MVSCKSGSSYLRSTLTDMRQTAKSTFKHLVLQAHRDEVEEFVHAGFVQAHDGRMRKLSAHRTRCQQNGSDSSGGGGNNGIINNFACKEARVTRWATTAFLFERGTEVHPSRVRTLRGNHVLRSIVFPTNGRSCKQQRLLHCFILQAIRFHARCNRTCRFILSFSCCCRSLYYVVESVVGREARTMRVVSPINTSSAVGFVAKVFRCIFYGPLDVVR